MVVNVFRNEYAWLSNFHWFNGTTVEHHYQADKTLDPDWRKRILSASTPGKAKRLGQACPVRADWEKVKRDVMLRHLRTKFADPQLKAKLLATGEDELVEGNEWHDLYWGRCYCARHGGRGQNWLGRLLMQVRKELR